MAHCNGYIFFALNFVLLETSAENFGNACTLPNNTRGRCVQLSKCSSAIENIIQSTIPQFCSFDGTEPLVCCRVSENIVTRPETRNGEKSRQKCEMFHNVNIDDAIVFPQSSVPRNLGGTFQPPPPATVGGKESLSKEFPHMAALGFEDQNEIRWYCGGSLISEDYVITAAHCLFSKDLGDVKTVRLGDLNLHSTIDDAKPQDFGIKNRIPHPDFNPPLQYNDIALIQLDRKATFTDYVKPICLHTNFDLPNFKPIATGWGVTQFGGQQSDILMKVSLSYFDIDTCRRIYNQTQRRLPRGIVEETQICAGGINEEKDTCQGDSGGPLQFVDNKRPYLVGITSFGRACGIANTPGVYTRVSFYVPWIESIVWPDYN